MLNLSVIPYSKGKPTFAKLSRQDTGCHFMDSGGAKGRHWQRPLPKDFITLEVNRWQNRATGEKNVDVMAYIPLHEFLDAYLEIDIELTRKLRRLEREAGHRFNYADGAEAFAEAMGLEVLYSDYSYNWENDLTQDFQFSVIGSKDDSDWYYSENVYFLVETHNGADARGGFSDIVVCKPTSYNGGVGLLEPQAMMQIESGKNVDGSEMTYEQMRKIDEKWEVGYAQYAMGAFHNDLDKVIKEVKNKGVITKLIVKLKSGQVVTVYGASRYEYV